MTQDVSFDVSWVFVIYPLRLAASSPPPRRSSYPSFVVPPFVVPFVGYLVVRRALHSLLCAMPFVHCACCSLSCVVMSSVVVN